MKENADEQQFRTYREAVARNTWQTKRHRPTPQERRLALEQKVELAMYWETRLRDARRARGQNP